jgi:restriction system protein
MKDDNHITYYDAIDGNRHISESDGGHKTLFQAPGWCPYCKVEGNIFFDKEFSKLWDDEEYPDPTLNEYHHLQVWLCNCGWWDILRIYNTGHDSIDPPYHFKDMRHAILKKYEISDPELPMTALRKELLKRIDIIHSIGDKKMEELVASVLSDHFGKCEATICGKVADGGIDVILIESEKSSIPVQVKRRINPKKPEPVSLIREFIAAVQLRGYDRGLYVTTAERFTKPAIKESQTAVSRGLVSQFELINKSKFLGFIKSNSNSVKEPWQKHLEDFME